MDTNRKNELGVFWKTQSNSGVKYLRGVLRTKSGDRPVVIFANGYKKQIPEDSKKPDYILYESQPPKQEPSIGNLEDDVREPSQPSTSETADIL